MIKKLDTRYGKMFVPENDKGQYWWLANTGASPEDQFIEPICELLRERPKGCAVDVGANFGCWTLPLARVSHTVVAIEPQAPVHQLLHRSILANNLHNVELIRMAAGDHSGIAKVPVLNIEHDANFGGVEVNAAMEHQPDAPMEAVHLNKLDIILMGYQVSFIKIDVEGYEQKVLDGARQTIARCRPILFLEMDHPRSNPEGLKYTLVDMNYAVEKQGGNYLGLPL